jgi:hypothetical protein
MPDEPTEAGNTAFLQFMAEMDGPSFDRVEKEVSLRGKTIDRRSLKDIEEVNRQKVAFAKKAADAEILTEEQKQKNILEIRKVTERQLREEIAKTQKVVAQDKPLASTPTPDTQPKVQKIRAQRSAAVRETLAEEKRVAAATRETALAIERETSAVNANTKAKVANVRAGQGIGAYATQLLKGGTSAADTLAAVKSQFPDSKTSIKGIYTYASQAGIKLAGPGSINRPTDNQRLLRAVAAAKQTNEGYSQEEIEGIAALETQVAKVRARPIKPPKTLPKGKTSYPYDSRLASSQYIERTPTLRTLEVGNESAVTGRLDLAHIPPWMREQGIKGRYLSVDEVRAKTQYQGKGYGGRFYAEALRESHERKMKGLYSEDPTGARGARSIEAERSYERLAKFPGVKVKEYGRSEEGVEAFTASIANRAAFDKEFERRYGVKPQSPAVVKGSARKSASTVQSTPVATVIKPLATAQVDTAAKHGIGTFAKDLLRQGVGARDTLNLVLAQFPDAKTTMNSIYTYASEAGVPLAKVAGGSRTPHIGGGSSTGGGGRGGGTGGGGGGDKPPRPPGGPQPPEEDPWKRKKSPEENAEISLQRQRSAALYQLWKQDRAEYERQLIQRVNAAKKFQKEIVRSEEADAKNRAQRENYGYAQESKIRAQMGKDYTKHKGEELALEKRNNAAVLSLQKQRSDALIRIHNKEQQAQRLAANPPKGRQSTGGTGGYARAQGNLAGVSSALGFAGPFIGATGLGSLQSALAAGPAAGAIGGIAVAGLAVAGIVKLVAAANKEQAQLNVTARDTGQSYSEAKANIDTFLGSMIATRMEAAAVALAFGELRLVMGQTFTAGQGEALVKMATARGLSPDTTATALKGLSEGSADAFKELTGLRGDVILEDYARAAGTVTSRLTEMEKAQILTNAAMKESSGYANLAAQRLNTVEAAASSLWNSISSGLAKWGQAFWDQMKFQGPEEVYKREAAAAEANDKISREIALKKIAETKQRMATEKAERDLKKRFMDDERIAAKRTSESFDAIGSTVLESNARQLSLLSAQFKDVADQWDYLEKNKANLSTDTVETMRFQLEDRGAALNVQNREVEDAPYKDAYGKIKELGRTVLGSLNELSQLQLIGESNPYVKLALDADAALQSTQEKFKQFGPEVVAKLQAANLEAAAVSKYQQRITDGMRAVSLEFEATDLAKPFRELTGEMKRSLDVWQAEFKARDQNRNLEREAKLYERGFDPTSVFQRDREQFEYVRSIARDRPSNDTALGRQINKQLNEFVLQQTAGITPGDRFGDPKRRELAQYKAEALRDQILQNEEEVKDVKARAEVSRGAVKQARAQLSELARLSGNAPDNEGARAATRGQFLAITGALPREEMTPDLLKGRIAALQEEAQYTRGQEQRADAAMTATLALRDGLVGTDGKSGMIGQMLQALVSRDRNLLVTITQRYDSYGVEATLGRLPAAQQ